MKTFKTRWQNVNTKIESFFNMLYEGFMKFFRKHYLWLVFVAVLIASIIVRVAFFYYISGDMRYALLTWFNYLKANGGFKALGAYPWKETGITKPGDYPVAYINLLALLVLLSN
ncbi:MAG: hypothetical protein ACOX3C_00720 [Bacilli bacterium]